MERKLGLCGDLGLSWLLAQEREAGEGFIGGLGSGEPGPRPEFLSTPVSYPGLNPGTPVSSLLPHSSPFEKRHFTVPADHSCPQAAPIRPRLCGVGVLLGDREGHLLWWVSVSEGPLRLANCLRGAVCRAAGSPRLCVWTFLARTSSPRSSFSLLFFDLGLTSSLEVSVFSDVLRWQIHSVRASICMLSSHVWR